MTSVYLETTIVSYLAARPSRDLIVAAHQQITHDWWETSRRGYELFVSEAVLEEIRRGDPEAAQRRLKIVGDLPLLELNDDAERLALTYGKELGLPDGAAVDVLHIAIAVVHRMDFLLTWNCAHIANGEVVRRLRTLNDGALKRQTPIIVTPEELVRVPSGGGEE